uniref:Sperm-activating peptide (Thr-5 speract) n=5 Tax=Echinidea TaxID=7675 RepID=Q7M4C8_STRPU|nr:peptide A1,sperm activating [Heliocidaris sp. 'Anthocidaris']prf//1616199N sperm-activating peptide I (5-Thr) [Mesocentrotus nudus]
GFDLTGGGVG